MKYFFYNYLLLPLFKTYFFIGRFFSAKINKAYKGRQANLLNLEKKLNLIHQKILWVHCASLGEYEQGLSLIKSWKNYFSNYYILISFFSPSGYEIKYQNSVADYVCYLPIDTQKNVATFLRVVKPNLAIFVKYEIWPNFLLHLTKNNIPAILISAYFHQDQIIFHPLLKFYFNLLKCFKYIFVQDEDSRNILINFGLKNKILVGGDTRFDTVNVTVNTKWCDEYINDFVGKDPVLIAGSAYYSDCPLLEYALHINPEFKLIIAPHEVNSTNIKKIASFFPDALYFSEKKPILKNNNLLIIDSIGILNKIYRLAHIVYIGGGFEKSGIHNITEAIGYKKLVLIGPNYKRHLEAKKLIELKGIVEITNKEEFSFVLSEYLIDKNKWGSYIDISFQYFQQYLHSAEKILKYLKENLIL